MTTGRDGLATFLLGVRPFGDAFEQFLDAYFEVAPILRKFANEAKRDPSKFWNDVNLTREINNRFQDIVSSDSNHPDPHLAAGPFGSLRSYRPNSISFETRQSLLLKRDFQRAAALESEYIKRIPKKNRQAQAEFVFSPLLFIRQILTDPRHQASEAYAHVVIRAYIFFQAILCWRQFFSSEEGNGFANAYDFVRNAISFRNVADCLQKLTSHSRSRDNVEIRNSTDFIVFNLLASQGYLICRFRPSTLSAGKSGSRPFLSLSDFLKAGDIFSPAGLCEFRRLPEVRELPAADELINELDGLPLPLDGADIIFRRGLRFTEGNGVVARFTGKPGTGKTSLALAIALSLAPLGVRTFFLSCEEMRADLLHRIRTLVPPFVARTSSWRDPSKWFDADYVRGQADTKLDSVLSSLDQIIDRLKGNLPSKKNCPPGLAPLVIVIDGLHEMFAGAAMTPDMKAYKIRELVEKCNETGALVIVMSGSSQEGELAAIDYLVDVVAHLTHSKSIEGFDAPIRRFDLIKTRRQLSRMGAHALHLASPQGLSFSPQLGAQLSHVESRRWIEPDERRWFDFLQKHADDSGPPRAAPLVRIFDRSHVLITGEGSSSKSVLGMRLLSSQLISSDFVKNSPSDRNQSVLRQADLLARDDDPHLMADDLLHGWYKEVNAQLRRILIISFLYQEPYYDRAKRVTQRYWKLDTLFPDLIPETRQDVMSFSPGFLTPEDLVSKIQRKILEADLEGLPYQGILLDGIQNIYLQFPLLEKSEMVWPLLYEIFRVAGISVVSTYTHFAMNSSSDHGLVDVEAARRRVGPLLHALVQATDFVIRVNPLPAQTAAGAKLRTRFHLELGTSIDVNTPISSRDWIWDRQRAVVTHK